MNALNQIWISTKTEIDVWFFYLFLLFFPFSIRKVITFYPIRGQFNEYTGIFLYLSDIFLILTFLSWLIILCHKYSILSIVKLLLIPRHNLWTKLYPQFSPRNTLAYFSLILILWSFLSISWSDNQIIALIRSIKLLEFFLLAIYVNFRIVPRGTFLKDTSKLIVLGGVINSILAIWQFILQHSLGLTFLKESVLSPNFTGVAKIILSGHKFIRAYGFFPHPNILGGFLLFSIILTIYYRQMFHVEHSKDENRENRINVPRGTFSNWQKIFLTIQIIALIMTFSKSAMIGLIITLLYIAFLPWSKCSTWNISTAMKQLRRLFGALFQNIFGVSRPWKPKDHLGLFHVEQLSENQQANPKNWHQMFHVEHLVKLSIVLFFVISILISIFPNLIPIRSQSLDQREVLSNVPRGTIFDNPILGVGQGQLIWSVRHNSELLDWQFQPVHNVFILVWSELGIVGLIFFVWMLWKMFHLPVCRQAPAQSNVPRLPETEMFHVEHFWAGGTLYIFQGILIGFMFVMLFDHYLWDIQQGQIILSLVIGLIYGLNITDDTSDIISLYSRNEKSAL